MGVNTADAHRARTKQILKEKVFPHQRNAAQKTFSAFDPESRTVIMAAEMQSGKSGVALGLACFQRLSLSNDDIVNQSKLKDTLYLLTMPDTALLDQAKEDLRYAMNVVVSNLNHFQRDLDLKFTPYKPKLIIIDECHYGSSENAVRYEKLFDYIETKNQDCYVVFISATPLSALLAAEEEAVLRKGLTTKLLFHRASDEYRGIRQMERAGQVIALSGSSRNLMNRSKNRDDFFEHIFEYPSPGWALVRVPSGSAMDAKKLFVRNGFEESCVFIIGSSLQGVPEKELISIDQFKIEFEQGLLFGKKMIALTVAGARAGINFGQDMKKNLIASWDSSVSSVAAIVQANIGRACGYHLNVEAKHYTNKHGVKAYSDVVDYLEKNCTTHATDDLSGLREEFERICGKYELRGLDVGARVTKGKGSKSSQSLFDYRAFATDSYLVVPARLFEEHGFSEYTDDPVYLAAIGELRDTLLANGGPEVKSSRALQKGTNVLASWVNGDTFSNPEKAIKGGPAFERVTNFIVKLDLDENLSFNEIVPAGGGVDVKTRDVAAYVFSIYNESKREVLKKVMSLDEVGEVADAFDVAVDDTIFVLFKKGEFSRILTDQFIDQKLAEEKGQIKEASKFQRDYS